MAFTVDAMEGASVAPRAATRAEVDVSLTGVLHKLFRQERSGLTGERTRIGHSTPGTQLLFLVGLEIRPGRLGLLGRPLLFCPGLPGCTL